MSALLLALTFLPSNKDIRVEGNVRVPTESIAYYVSGVPEDELPKAFQRLWETGLFEDIRFETEGDTLVVIVVEKPLLASFRIEGDNVPRDDLIEALRASGVDLNPNRAFGEDDAREVERLTRQFVGPDFEVSVTTSELADGRVELVLAVSPATVEKISAITFEGNEALSEAELRRAMRLQPKSWTSWLTQRDRLTETGLEADLERLRELYRSRGYLDVRVGPVEMRPHLLVPIAEGSLYRLEEIAVEPGSLLTTEQVSSWLPPEGDIFDDSAVEAVVSRLEHYYQSRGYPAVRVVREQTAVAGSVRVTLRVDEGAFMRVGTITFRGNTRHRDRDLRQHLDFAESDRFNQELLERGIQRMSRLETIENVVPEIDFTTRPGRADVVFHVEEVDRFEYLVGGGLTGTQGGTGNGQFIAKSLLGRGEVFRFDVDFGNRFQNFVVGYRDPSTLGHRLFFALDFARADLTFPDETSEDSLDAAFRIGGPQGNKWQFLGGFRYLEFTLGSDLEEDVAFLTPFLGERFRTSRASFNVAYEGRDNTIFPTRGTALQLGVELVTGDVEATKARARLSRLVPLSRDRRHILSLAGRVEAVWPFGDTVDQGLPRFERLFLGNENDMRGFAIRGVGPRQTDAVVGGDRLVWGTAEYQFALHPRLRLVGFFDLGNVYASDFEGVELPRLRYDAGAELQLLTPVWNFPFRIGYGFNLDPVLDEDPGRFFVTFALRF